MLAYRWTWIIKHGQMQKFLELHKTTPGVRSKEYAKLRFYTPSIGPNVWVTEMVVENEEASTKWFTEFNATPGAAAFWEKVHTMAERMVSSERWNVTEL
jgi:hypothetical protein